MSQLFYIVGDATAPSGDGCKLIAHVCNDRGGWGSGFVNAISRCWDFPEHRYRAWWSRRNSNDFALGACQFVRVTEDIVVANMIAQRGFRMRGNPKPLRYDALERCLVTVAEYARDHAATVHMPRIGNGRGGGDWDTIVSIIKRTLIARGITTVVYDLPPRRYSFR
ncbi:MULTISPECIES: hypothetical protein [unclassified Crossiella]|uniref:hypothetical protein n=1 Tax=unclassified Crossiella TaxID=2620835 RepID=UPI001FFE3BB9|nr:MULTISPECIES: hypothetical protein [unclassified Crossiella]MCK2240016.1 hypothetical protein [Crossiella sp. S99.2]MCK2252724.1 hypothetical protein [Crossiella sp. S99.1]